MANKPDDYVFGRPCKYKPEYCKIAIDMGREGKTSLHIGNKIGVVKSTLHEWAKKYPDFSNALEFSKNLAHQFHMDELDSTENPTRFNAKKWMLSACFGQSEVQKMEQDIKQEVKTEVSFGEKESEFED